jgi:hypothetical protein
MSFGVRIFTAPAIKGLRVRESSIAALPVYLGAVISMRGVSLPTRRARHLILYENRTPADRGTGAAAFIHQHLRRTEALMMKTVVLAVLFVVVGGLFALWSIENVREKRSDPIYRAKAK